MLLLTLVVLGFALIVIFSQEFTGWFKKLMAIPGVLLLLPLAMASYVFIIFPSVFSGVVRVLKIILDSISNFLQYLLPFTTGREEMALLIILTTLAILPMYISRLRKNIAARAIIWVSAAVVYVM